jgi:hypothetical protein
LTECSNGRVQLDLMRALIQQPGIPSRRKEKGLWNLQASPEAGSEQLGLAQFKETLAVYLNLVIAIVKSNAVGQFRSPAALRIIRDQAHAHEQSTA